MFLGGSNKCQIVTVYSGEIIHLLTYGSIYPVFKVAANIEIKLIYEVVISVLTSVVVQWQTLIFKGES